MGGGAAHEEKDVCVLLLLRGRRPDYGIEEDNLQANCGAE